jgi:hypothetical protein
MTEIQRLQRLVELLRELLLHTLDPGFLRREVLEILNERFGDYGGFLLGSDTPLADCCKRVEGTHLQVHTSTSVTTQKKKFEFGSADAPYLTRNAEAGHLSETSSKLLHRSSHHAVGEFDEDAREIKAYHSAQLLQATGFDDHHFELNANTFENPYLPGIHATPDAYLRKGKHFVPVEITDITRAARKARKTHEDQLAKECHSIPQAGCSMGRDSSHDAVSCASAPALGKRSRPSTPLSQKQTPFYAAPSSRTPVPHQVQHGVLTNLTDPRASRAFVIPSQKQQVVSIDAAAGCPTAFKAQLSTKAAQCTLQMAAMGAKSGLVLLWDKQHCTIYYRILSRDHRFEQKLREIIRNSNSIRDLTYQQQPDPAPLPQPAAPTRVVRNVRSSLPAKPKFRPQSAGPALLEEHRQKARAMHDVAMLGEEAQAALASDSSRCDRDSKTPPDASDASWDQ